MKKILIFLIPLAVFSCKNEEKPNIPELSSKLDTKTPIINSTKESSTVNKDNILFQQGTSSALAPIVETGVYADVQGNFHLKYVFEKGKTYNYNIRSVGKQTTTYKKQSQTAKEETYEPIQLTVLDFNNGVYTFNVKMNGQKTTMEVGGKKQVIDINGKAPDVGKDQLVGWKANKVIKNSSFQMKMDIYGNIVSVSGLEAIYSKVQSAIEKDLTKDQLKEVMAITKQSFGEQAIKALFQGNMVRFPEKGLKIGEKWNPNPANKNSGHIQLVKVDENIAELKITAKLPSQSDSKTIEGVTVKMSANGTKNGAIFIDRKTGWISKANFVVSITETRLAKKGDQTDKAVQKTINTTYINN